MDLTGLLLFCFISLVIGAVLMLIVQYYVFVRYCDLPDITEEQKDINDKYSLPKDVHLDAKNIEHHSSDLSSKSPLVAINFVMQFLFHELKNSNRVRKWFYRKLSLELDELIAKTTTGKLFDKLTIKELDLGDQFPEIKNLRVHNVEVHETEGRIENLDLLLEIQYKGNFRTSIDADMVLGKKGSLTLKVRKLSGLARLQFTRKPYTHWSLSFVGDPELDLDVESKYQGRQMQSNITSLISNQIRKAVRRKHTLPNYKLRYKPFFHRTPEDDCIGDGEIQPNGSLKVKVSELSRLMHSENITEIYCILTMASMAWVETRQKDDRNVIVTLDIEIHKAKNQQIGIVFKQSDQLLVEIEAVLPNTPACKSNLQPGDVLIAVEGKPVTTIQQVAKLFKGLQNLIFSLRIERCVPGIIRNDAILEDLELYEDFSKPSEPPDILGKLTKYNAECKANTSSGESSLVNTPNSSPKKTKLIAKALKKTLIRDNINLISTATEGKRKSKTITVQTQSVQPAVEATESSNLMDVEHYQQHSTVDCSVDRLIYMEDLSIFKLDTSCKYLNVCVYGKRLGDSELLGYVNIPISSVLAECTETSLSQSMKTFDLLPPFYHDFKSDYLSMQSGFEPNLCFGDILIAFTWDGNPTVQVTPIETPSKQASKLKSKASPDKSSADESNSMEKTSDNASQLSVNRTHNFIRTHFHRSTQCDFCGKKIWLKDAVQCRDCSMSCHKKCVTKCQNSTVCGPVDCTNVLQTSQILSSQSPIVAAPEFTVTEVSNCAAEMDSDTSDFQQINDDDVPPKTLTAPEVGRPSLTGLLAQSLKRVNSANNLAIPGIVSTFGRTSNNSVDSKSLPPSPQHSPRKRSIVDVEILNPFELVTKKLEAIPDHITQLSQEQISEITEPVIHMTKDDDMMTLAKTASKELYPDMDAATRVEKINSLLSKLRLALDSETAIYSTLLASTNDTEHISLPQAPILLTDENSCVSTEDQMVSGDSIVDSCEIQVTNRLDNTNTTSVTAKASILCESEERVQALSVIMLYLCTGLQYAQGVVSH